MSRKFKNFWKIVLPILVVILILSLFISNGNLNSTRKEIKNLIWMLPATSEEYHNELINPQNMIDKIKDSNIDCIAVYGGSWISNGSISFDRGASFEIWNKFIIEIHSWKPDLKVIVWVNGWNDTCDLRNSTIRTLMCNSAKNLLTAVPFDGWNEDYEGGAVYGTTYLISFYHELSSTIKNMNKLATVALEVDWGGYKIEEVYPYINGFDYATAMFYKNIATDRATYYWNTVLSNSSIPVLMGLAVDPEESGGVHLSEQLAWINNQSTTNLAGFALWCYDYMTDADINAWNNWVRGK